MRTSRVCLATSLVLTVMSCACERWHSNAQEREETPVSGWVTAKGSERRIPFATVELSPVAPVRADSMGRFVLKPLPAGKYFIRIVAPGISSDLAEVKLPLPSGAQIEVVVDSASTACFDYCAKTNTRVYVRGSAG